MGPRKAVDVVTKNPIPDLQEPYEGLAAQQVDLRVLIDKKIQDLRDDMKRRHTEMIQMVSALKSSFDGVQLHQQSRESASTSNNRDQVAQMRQGILGPNPYRTNFNGRGHNLLFPRFNGENLKTWLYRDEQYFIVDNTLDNLKVDLVAMNLDDEALGWHQLYLKCRDSVLPLNWEEYLASLVETSGEEFADPMLELKQLRQTRSVRECQFSFARLLAQCDLSVSQAISCFLGGLKEELANPVKLHEPQTLSKTYRLTRLAEATLAANAELTNTIPQLEFPKEELVEEDLSKYECDSPKEEWSNSKGDTPMISLCALNGLQGAQTIHVTGYSDRRPIQILLDGGSTHNFIDEESAKRLGCTVHPTKVGYVSLGNNTLEATLRVVRKFEWILQGTTFTSDLIVFPVGKYDLVLGALWMKTLGPVTMDHSNLTMIFNYQGKFHLLKGVTDECKVLNSKAIGKLKGEEVQLFMLHVVTAQHTSTNSSQLNAIHLAIEHHIPAPIEHLLRRHSQIFAEPTSLPLSGPI
nr:uncharacterized protein LOC104108732 [Nicotiana tomentosiformis]